VDILNRLKSPLVSAIAEFLKTSRFDGNKTLIILKHYPPKINWYKENHMSEDRPRIKVGLSQIDYLIEIIALLALVVLIGYPTYVFPELPQSIPKHFNYLGQADAHGAKWMLFILPVIGTGLYILFTVLNRYPHVLNYFVPITVDNAEVQYSIVIHMLRVLKAVLMLSFLYIVDGSIKLALGSADGLGTLFLPAFLIAVFGPIIYYVRQSFRNK